MKDILLDILTFDLSIKNGDFEMGNSTWQNFMMLFQTRKSEWKQHPATGIGADDNFDNDELVEFENEIRVQLTDDGASINTLEVLENGEVNLDANYGEQG